MQSYDIMKNWEPSSGQGKTWKPEHEQKVLHGTGQIACFQTLQIMAVAGLKKNGMVSEYDIKL